MAVGPGGTKNQSQQNGAQRVDNCNHIKLERSWEVILDRKE